MVAPRHCRGGGGDGEGHCELSLLSSRVGEDEGESRRRVWNDENCKRGGCIFVIVGPRQILRGKGDKGAMTTTGTSTAVEIC